MKLWNHYHTPASIDDALELLSRYSGQARVIAGGTDLLVEMRASAHAPHEALIDITRVAPMTAIETDGDYVLIGAGATHTQIVKSPLLAEHAVCLVESCGVIGGPQVRNVATLGGNVAHALPAGDGTVSLVALDAEAEVVKDGERQWLPIRTLFVGPGKSLLDSSRDLLIRFRVRRRTPGEASSFSRVMRPQGVALPILGCAVWVKLSADGSRYEAVRVCVAPAGPTPARADDVETALVGQPADAAAIDRAIELAQATLTLRTSKYRATADYRHEMVAVLLRRTLTSAVERARQA